LQGNPDDALGGEGFADLLLLYLTQVILFEVFAVVVGGGIDDAGIFGRYVFVEGLFVEGAGFL